MPVSNILKQPNFQLQETRKTEDNFIIERRGITSEIDINETEIKKIIKCQ